MLYMLHAVYVVYAVYAVHAVCSSYINCVGMTYQPRIVSITMRVMVTVVSMSGSPLTCDMDSRSTLVSLKRRLHASTGAKAPELALLQGGRLVGDSETLGDLADWFVLGDVVGDGCCDLVLEIALTMVVLPKICGYCGRGARKKCSGCGCIRYCSIACQRSHWAAHRACCM